MCGHCGGRRPTERDLFVLTSSAISRDLRAFSDITFLRAEWRMALSDAVNWGAGNELIKLKRVYTYLKVWIRFYGFIGSQLEINFRKGSCSVHIDEALHHIFCFAYKC